MSWSAKSNIGSVPSSSQSEGHRFPHAASILTCLKSSGQSVPGLLEVLKAYCSITAWSWEHSWEEIKCGFTPALSDQSSAPSQVFVTKSGLQISTTPCLWWCNPCNILQGFGKPGLPRSSHSLLSRGKARFTSSLLAAEQVQSLCCSRLQSPSASWLASRRFTSQTWGLCMNLNSHRKAGILYMLVDLFGSQHCGRHELWWLVCCSWGWGIKLSELHWLTSSSASLSTVHPAANFT